MLFVKVFESNLFLYVISCKMGKIKSIEYFRVMPRWLFVKICDEDGNYGWGEATLEGHTEAVEGTLDGLIKRFMGLEADDIEHIWQLAWRLGRLPVRIILQFITLGVPEHQKGGAS